MVAEEETRPLLNEDTKSSSSSRPFELSSESTPLLLRHDDDLLQYGTEPRRASVSSVSQISLPDRSSKKPRSRIRWPIFCILISLIAILSILVFAFLAPAVVKKYVKEAAVFKPTDISIESTTADGVRARVRGEFFLDAGRVQKTPARNLGRLATWIAREVETGQSEVQAYLPEYGNVLVGTASLPSIKVDIQNGHKNQIDFLADLAIGDVPGLRTVAVDWLEGRLGRLRIIGKATVHIQSGLVSLGEQILSESVTLEEKNFPALPEVKIARVNVHDADSPEQSGTMAVDVSLAAMIDSPFSLNIPSLGFEVLVPSCSPGDPRIVVAHATTKEFQITPGHSTTMDVASIIRGLPEELTTACPGKDDSPLDSIVKSYIQGGQTTVYVRGADTPTPGTPAWMVDILKSVTVPVPFTGKALDNLVRNFTMSEVHFTIPDPMAEPDSPESQLKVSALVKVLVALPEQFSLHLDVQRVRAAADVYYHGNKLGVLTLPGWQPATSTSVVDTDGSPALLLEFAVTDAPLQVTDDDVLTDVIQALIFGGKPVELHVAASVDAEVSTGIGLFAVRGIPAEGDMNIKPPYAGSIDQLNPRIDALELGYTTDSSILVKTRVNITNPSQYSASVPYSDFVLLYNATRVAHITARDASIVPGLNTGLYVEFLWTPLEGGPNGVSAGRKLLSEYISGSNTTVTIQGHRETIPALPKLGEALSKFRFEAQIPRVPFPGSPKDPDNADGKPEFIKEATLHLWSSTAEFTLSSPFPNTTIEITSVEANASYVQDEELGSINYYHTFQVPPGTSQTPRLPVDLNLRGIGYDALKKALGGSLKMDAVAKVGVRIQHYDDTILYHGKGITANVKM